METFLSIIYSLLMLSGLVVIHEFGHYIAAKKCGINVAEFAIGFGPRLIKWHRSGTEFSFRPILIGGFVKFNDDEEEIKEGDFRAAKLKHKIITIAAGPIMNILVAFLIAVIVLCVFGDYVPVVSNVTPNSAAYAAGIQEGDIIKNINGVNIDFSYDMQDAYKTVGGESIKVTVQRGDELINMDIPFEADEEGNQVAKFGMKTEKKAFNFFESIALSFKWLFLLVREMITTLGSLIFMGQGVENLTGIVGVVAVVGVAAQSGINIVLMLAAMISINLAIINLLPIPALDGGQIVIYLIEGIIRRPIPPKVISIINTIGLILIFALAGYLVFQDVSRLVG